MKKQSAANVNPVRQRSQYTCMAASMMMCLKANGVECDEDEVNRVMGARPMEGAAWESALACAQHYGMRATLTVPATVNQIKAWTDRGIPVMIAWNPEGRPWSHASVVFDVKDDGTVYVADPNIPNPEETVRVVSKDEFYHLWFEKFPDYLVRRPAMAVEREITPDGRQVMASSLSQPLSTRPDYGSHTAAGRPIKEVAQEIALDLQSWRGGKVYYAAKPYLDAMHDLNRVEDNYMAETGASIVSYFLANAQAYQGPMAKQRKAELKKMVDEYYRHSRAASGRVVSRFLKGSKA